MRLTEVQDALAASETEAHWFVQERAKLTQRLGALRRPDYLDAKARTELLQRQVRNEHPY